MAAVAHDDEHDGHEHGYPFLSVGFDASEWTAEQLVAYASRSPIQVSLDQVSQGLAGLGLPAEVRQAMLAVLTSTAAHTDPHLHAPHDPRESSSSGDSTTGQRMGDGATQPTAARVRARVASTEAISDQDVLAAAHGTRVLTGFAEGALIETARTLADRAGTELLARKHLHDPAELGVWGSRRTVTQ